MRISAGIINIFLAAAHHIAAVIRTISDDLLFSRTFFFQNIPLGLAQFAVLTRIFIVIKIAAAGTVFLADKADFGQRLR